MKEKEKREKADFKLNIQKTRIMAFSLVALWQIDGQIIETVIDFIFLGSKITVDGASTMKLEDACSLKENLWQT